MNVARSMFAAIFVVAGVLHFVLTPMYVRIMPNYLPGPVVLVWVSGVAEILGGLGLLYPPTRQAAAWGIIALLVCVSPANVQMAMDHARWTRIPEWVLWARIPMQIPLLAWAWVYTRGG